VSQIHDEARAGNLDKVKALVQANAAAVSARDKDSRTPLHYAVSNIGLEVVEFLLASKAEVDVKCNRGYTPLHMAAANGARGAAEILLANGANVNAKGIFARTPLHLAAEYGKLDVAELLLAHKADVHAMDTHDGATPLSAAESTKNAEMVELLRRHVAVNKQSDPGENLSRWKASQQPESWVKQHLEGWNQNDWLDLLALLRDSQYWPMDEAAVGQHIEVLRAKLKTTEVKEPSKVDVQEASASGVVETAKAPIPADPEIKLAYEGVAGTPEKAKRKPSAAFMKAVTPDEKLAKIVGDSPLPRTELTKKLWVYIREHGLQDATKKTLINADENLKAVFDGKEQVSMFEMTKLVSGHVKK
jgi:upstream activation factor subunit UAF30